MPRSINYMNMVDSLHNVGGLLNKYDIRRNIELIRTLYIFPFIRNTAGTADMAQGIFHTVQISHPVIYNRYHITAFPSYSAAHPR